VPPTIDQVNNCIQLIVDQQQNQIRREIQRLQGDRKSALEGNMAFSFGYNSSISDYDRQILQATNSLISLNSRVLRTLIVCDADTKDLEAFAIVDQGCGKMVLVDGWQVQLVSIDAEVGPKMLRCNVGAFLSFGLVVSTDGGPILTQLQQQIAHEPQKQQSKHKHPGSIDEEEVRLRQEHILQQEHVAELARAEQRKHLEASRIAQEAAKAKQKRETAEQKALQNKQEALWVQQDRLREKEEGKRQQEKLLRQQEEKERQQQQEKQWKERRFAMEIASREKRLDLDALRLKKYPELVHHAEKLKIAQELQALFNVPGFQYTPLLEIELDQAIVHEMRSLSAFREEAEVLECLANEQELQEVQRLQQEQATKQEQEAKQKQEALDKHAAQYERSTEPLVYEKAIIQFQEIQHYVGEAVSSHIIHERASTLRSRCMKSRDTVPSTSVKAPASDGVGTKVGAIMGGLFGMMGGPLGMAIGAAAGGFIGNIADHAGDSASTSQARPERKQWTTLISNIDELISKLPE